MDHRLIDLLVCPLCKGPVTMLRDTDNRPTGLACRADRLVFPMQDGIPVMLESEATALADEPPPAAPVLDGSTP